MLVAIDNISSGAIKGALVLQFIHLVNQCNGAFKKTPKTGNKQSCVTSQQF